MMNGSPSERPDWFLRGVLAQVLAFETIHLNPVNDLQSRANSDALLSVTLTVSIRIWL